MTRLLLLTALAAFAQPLPTFDVASVKPAADLRGNSYMFTDGGGLEVKGGTLKGLIEMAYELREFQVIGGPGWANADRFDIVAKSPPGDPSVKTTRLRLRALLAERFHLEARQETRELPVYALVQGSKGSRLVDSEAPANSSGGKGASSGCGTIGGNLSTMPVLAIVLARQLGRPVQDRTGLTGHYNFTLEYTPEDKPCPDSSVERPSLFAAIQEQLGLKLEATKGPVDVVVIDQAQKPTEN